MMNAQIQQAGLLSGRHVTFMVVVGLHALAITALIAIRIIPENNKVPVIDLIPIPPEVRMDPVPPDPILPPAVAERKLVFELPDITIREPIDAQEAVTIQTPERAMAPDGTGATAVAADATPAARTSTALQYQIVRPTDDFYPDASVMLEERGIAVVQVCVDSAGRISGQPTIQASSGHKRLDQAAIRWARESLRFTPATVDGMAVAACKGFRVNFNLR